MERLRVVSWGELVWDTFADTRRLGGAAANVAYHAAVLGAHASLISRVGDDEPGRAARGALAARGVETTLVQVDPERPTGRVEVATIDGEPRYQIAEQAAWDRIAFDADARAAVLRADVLVYGTLAQRTVLGRGALAEALAAAPARCLRLCDLNVRPPFDTREVIDEAIRHASAVKLNEAEAARLVAATGASDAVDYLLARGVGLVALTRGAAGALLASPRERLESAGVAVSTADGDAVGAGDAFSAVIAHLWPRGAGLAELGARANRYAGFVASRRGAMPEIPNDLARAITRAGA
ncbi:MAG: PfkB family carbohydrate kinase [Sorangiineae bacterium]|nr:PfkB family carbohydrate kinase [Polyangiaceae bacterium]MEB2322577.1 PfkB family carbohydrate kinase [Sorangiineae bacterium]